MIRNEISQALKDAMKAKNQIAVSTLRLIMAAIKDRDIAQRGEKGGDSDGISDQDVMKVLQTMVRQRHESIKLYEQGGRDDLARQEAEEIGIIEGFLPPQMSEAEIAGAVAAVIEETGAAGLKDMGRTMGLLRERYTGQMDFSRASALLKERLGAS